MSDVINIIYHNPLVCNPFVKASKSDRENVTYFRCSNKENCDLYKNKTCIMLQGLFANVPCPYGTTEYTEGYTKAARRCGELIAKVKADFPDAIYALRVPCRIGFVGDYFYHGLPWLDDTPYPFKDKESDFWGKSKSGRISGGLMAVKYFTPETIVELIKFKPYPWFGYEPIRAYSSKYIPEFCSQLKRYFPDMFEKVKAIYPEIEQVADISFVGKKAKLKTLKAGKVLVDSNHTFEWDGQKLIYVSSKYNPPCNLKGKFYVEPDADVIVEILDDNTVDENTEFEE